MESLSDADDYCRQAQARQKAGEFAAAEALYRQALALNPNHPHALNYLGVALCQLGQTAAALPWLERSVLLQPKNGEFHNNLGNAYQTFGQRDKALAAYRQAVRHAPGSPLYCANLGLFLWRRGQFDSALGYLEQALPFNPLSSSVHLARGSIFRDLGRVDDAVPSLRRAMDLGRGHELEVAHHNYLYTLLHHPDYPPEAISNAHKAWASQYADPLTAIAPAHRAGNDPERRLKIGYVSPHFRTHAVNFFMEPVLAAHDQSRYQVICYSDDSAPDETTARLRAAASGWREVAGCPDSELAQLVRADGIDILVDLCGHMGFPRLLAFARKPAPVQVTYLGYQATTGLRAMDYRLTDAYADPVGVTEAWHSEKLVRLPETFYCYRPPDHAPPVVDPPGIKRGFITFGSFNSFAKVTPQMLKVWAEILRRVPGSRLQLLIPESGSLRQRVFELMAAERIVAKRIVFVPRGPLTEYLKRFQTVDIALDPFPFNSHTTSCDGFWMGLPSVMLRGRSYVQRYGGVAAVCLGLQDLIADSPEAYVEIAVRWATDIARLTTLRRTLRGQMSNAVICDPVGFTRRLETAYRGMWQTFCNGASRD